jgi:hypothetical protein
MQILADITDWMFSVVKQWIPWVGGSALVVIIDTGHKLEFWPEPSKKVVIGILALGFIVSMFLSWRIERETVRREIARNSQPKFNARILEVFTGPISYMDSTSGDLVHHLRPYDTIMVLRVQAWNEINMASAAPRDCILRVTLFGSQQYAGATHLGNIPQDMPSIIVKGRTSSEANIGLPFRHFSFRTLQYQVPALEWLVFFMEGLHYSEICEAEEAEIDLEFISLSGGSSVVKRTKHRLIHGRVQCEGTP